ncbi:MAG: hypothetical protein AB8E15_03805 [Bdellovibrionales bacterium]
MKYALLLLIWVFSLTTYGKSISLSPNVHSKVPFSSQYSENGALIKSVDFRSINDLLPLIEMLSKQELNGRSLLHRNEAHITVITPPESKTGFFPESIGIDQKILTLDLIKNFRTDVQEARFDIICVGKRSDKKGNIVFYLVIESPDIIRIRESIYKVTKIDPRIKFHPTNNYHPHITIGFIGGDVHGVSKGKETCVYDVSVQSEI